jgi:lysophospholipase L1-like esterase
MTSDYHAMWIVLQLTNGNAFLFGIALLAAALAWSAFRKQNILTHVALLLGVVLVSASSTPLPIWFYALWAVGLVGFVVVSCSSRALYQKTTAFALIGLSFSAAVIEVPRHFGPGIVIDGKDTLYVIGDSVTAGIGEAEHDKTWPNLLRKDRGLRVIDLTRAGATLASALKNQQGAIPAGQSAHSAVILEIGGNDLLTNVGAASFRADLNQLLNAVRPKAHCIVMFELPLFPFQNDYGIAQRSLAMQYHVTLIPRHNFSNIIGAPGATIDGIHLSSSGQVLMAELVSRMIGSATDLSRGRNPESRTQLLNK